MEQLVRIKLPDNLDRVLNVRIPKSVYFLKIPGGMRMCWTPQRTCYGCSNTFLMYDKNDEELVKEHIEKCEKY